MGMDPALAGKQIGEAFAGMGSAIAQPAITQYNLERQQQEDQYKNALMAAQTKEQEGKASEYDNITVDADQFRAKTANAYKIPQLSQRTDSQGNLIGFDVKGYNDLYNQWIDKDSISDEHPHGTITMQQGHMDSLTQKALGDVTSQYTSSMNALKESLVSNRAFKLQDKTLDAQREENKKKLDAEMSLKKMSILADFQSKVSASTSSKQNEFNNKVTPILSVQNDVATAKSFLNPQEDKNGKITQPSDAQISAVQPILARLAKSKDFKVDPSLSGTLSELWSKLSDGTYQPEDISKINAVLDTYDKQADSQKDQLRQTIAQQHFKDTSIYPVGNAPKTLDESIQSIDPTGTMRVTKPNGQDITIPITKLPEFKSMYKAKTKREYGTR